MITFVTSVSLPYTKICRATNSIVKKQYKGHTAIKSILDSANYPCVIMRPEPFASPIEQLAFGDALIQWSRTKHVFTPNPYETTLLRLLRRIREGKFHHDKLQCIVLDKDRVAHTIRADFTGEFIDRWPEGFFDHRIGELF